MKRKKVYIITLILLSTFLFSSCKKREIILTTKFADGEIMRINDASCYMPEFMLYLVTVEDQYKNVYGNEIFTQVIGDETVEERIKDMVLAKVAQVKVMNLMARDYGVSLDDDEIVEVNSEAAAFFNTLTDYEKEYLNVNVETVAAAYKEFAMAEKLYDYVIRDINPEISDDEARIVTVQQILIKTYTVDGDGNKVEYSKRAKEEAFERATEVYNQAIAEDADFEALAALYNEDENTTYSFGRGEMAEAFENAAFLLNRDEVSKIVETESGYHIIKCINVLDIDETKAHKEVILKQRKEEVFDSTYDAYLKTLTKNLNEDLLNSIGLVLDPEVTTTGFFDADF